MDKDKLKRKVELYCKLHGNMISNEFILLAENNGSCAQCRKNRNGLCDVVCNSYVLVWDEWMYIKEIFRACDYTGYTKERPWWNMNYSYVCFGFLNDE
jgi:hypothetical protein